MGVMDFLKGLFSSSNEDQSVSNINITESGSSEPTQDVPQAPEMPAEPQASESNDNTGGADDSGFQE